jgi:hypothetical protein
MPAAPPPLVPLVYPVRYPPSPPDTLIHHSLLVFFLPLLRTSPLQIYDHLSRCLQRLVTDKNLGSKLEVIASEGIAKYFRELAAEAEDYTPSE